LARERVGRLQPIEVDAHVDEDADGDTAWFLIVVLADPPTGAQTWPIDDIVEYQKRARDKALELSVPWPWHLRFRPQTDAPQEEDTEEEV